MQIRSLAALAALAFSACHSPNQLGVPADATLLYDIDFSAPEHAVGQPPATVPEGTEMTFPSRIPSQIFFGNPTVVAKLCGLEQQPLQLALANAPQGMEGVEILLDKAHAHYHVELDLCIAQLGAPPLASQKMQLAVFLDIAAAYALGFMANGEIGVVEPDLAPETAENPKPVARYELNKPMHLAFDVDYDAQRWQIAIDGKQVYDGQIVMTIPRAVRVVLRGNPQNAAAFDNLVIWAQRPLAPDVDVPLPKTEGESK